MKLVKFAPHVAIVLLTFGMLYYAAAPKRSREEAPRISLPTPETAATTNSTPRIVDEGKAIAPPKKKLTDRIVADQPEADLLDPPARKKIILDRIVGDKEVVSPAPP